MAVALEPHERRRTKRVHNDAARGWHPCLTARKVVELQATLGKDALNVARHIRVFYESAAKDFGHYTLGNIIARGAESAGGNDEVGNGEGSLDSIADIGGIVADGAYAGNLPALFAKGAGDET